MPGVSALMLKPHLETENHDEVAPWWLKCLGSLKCSRFGASASVAEQSTGSVAEQSTGSVAEQSTWTEKPKLGWVTDGKSIYPTDNADQHEESQLIVYEVINGVKELSKVIAKSNEDARSEYNDRTRDRDRLLVENTEWGLWWCIKFMEAIVKESENDIQAKFKLINFVLNENNREDDLTKLMILTINYGTILHVDDTDRNKVQYIEYTNSNGRVRQYFDGKKMTSVEWHDHDNVVDKLINYNKNNMKEMSEIIDGRVIYKGRVTRIKTLNAYAKVDDKIKSIVQSHQDAPSKFKQVEEQFVKKVEDMQKIYSDMFYSPQIKQEIQALVNKSYKDFAKTNRNLQRYEKYGVEFNFSTDFVYINDNLVRLYYWGESTYQYMVGKILIAALDSSEVLPDEYVVNFLLERNGYFNASKYHNVDTLENEGRIYRNSPLGKTRERENTFGKDPENVNPGHANALIEAASKLREFNSSMKSELAAKRYLQPKSHRKSLKSNTKPASDESASDHSVSQIKSNKSASHESDVLQCERGESEVRPKPKMQSLKALRTRISFPSPSGIKKLFQNKRTQ
jgi:hypothetical protein